MSASLNHVVKALIEARLNAQKIAPLDFPVLGDIDNAYQVQHQIIGAYSQYANVALTGWKIALTGSTAQQKYGIQEPVYGQLLSNMQHHEHARIQLQADDAFKLEVELLFVLKDTLYPEQIYSDKQLLEAVDKIIPALEVVNVRWQNWNFDLNQFIADSAAAHSYVLGQPIQTELSISHLSRLITAPTQDIVITINEQDNPSKNFIWLMRTLLQQGYTIPAGHHVLTGSLIKPVSVQKGFYNIEIAGQNLSLTAE